MKKKITFEIETVEDDKRIESYLRSWLVDNFRDSEKSKIVIEDLK